ncbi:hypothetical protein CAL7102_04591 [Dulcicalothrix desertica PCC 7102]|nr:hypothetical protein CAL7102_04591 [Dulcicalothrix desertica PCC 7102]
MYEKIKYYYLEFLSSLKETLHMLLLGNFGESSKYDIQLEI